MADPSIDLRPKVLNLSAYRGDAWSLRITLTGMDLTGSTIAAQVRARPDSTEVLATLDVSPVDLSAGVFDIGQAAATEGGHYDVQITPGGTGGLPRTYVRGRLQVTADTTRA